MSQEIIYIRNIYHRSNDCEHLHVMLGRLKQSACANFVVKLLNMRLLHCDYSLNVVIWSTNLLCWLYNRSSSNEVKVLNWDVFLHFEIYYNLKSVNCDVYIASIHNRCLLYTASANEGNYFSSSRYLGVVTHYIFFVQYCYNSGIIEMGLFDRILLLHIRLNTERNLRNN